MMNGYALPRTVSSLSFMSQGIATGLSARLSSPFVTSLQQQLNLKEQGGSVTRPRSVAMSSSGKPLVMATSLPPAVSVDEAAKLLAEGRTYLDVRTPQEFGSAHPPSAVNVPFLLKSADGMVPNNEFKTQVTSSFELDTPLLVGCAAGMRSARAVAALRELGFTNVADVQGGFNAWQQQGLPTES